MYASTPLRSGPALTLCGQQVAMVASTQLAVTQAATACTGSVQLIAQDGEQANVPVTVPARAAAAPKVVTTAQLYCFGQPANRAVYITIDDGWTPSPEVLTLMHQNYLPITAFLISNAAKQNLAYWKEFTAAGGIIGDHTVSHPDLAKTTLAKATTQWKQARSSLGGWLGQTPVMGRPPYGDFNHDTEVAAARGGLTALAGWSAVMTDHGVQTWNGKALVPGEIVLLHWDAGLGQQLTALLATIRARHLNPTPLTLASFAGITPQKKSLDGD
jgi:peptidoglycan/xylan/chitin deacetylase (PgdA/CDA1 family)